MNIVMSIIESLAYQDLLVLGLQAKPSYCINYIRSSLFME